MGEQRRPRLAAILRQAEQVSELDRSPVPVGALEDLQGHRENPIESIGGSACVVEGQRWPRDVCSMVLAAKRVVYPPLRRARFLEVLRGRLLPLDPAGSCSSKHAQQHKGHQPRRNQTADASVPPLPAPGASLSASGLRPSHRSCRSFRAAPESFVVRPLRGGRIVARQLTQRFGAAAAGALPHQLPAPSTGDPLGTVVAA